MKYFGITKDIAVKHKFSEMRRNRANEILQVQKKVAEIEEINQEDELSLSKSLPEEAENIRPEGDSLFGKPWREDVSLSSSKIAKLMEQQVQEAARPNALAKAKKPISSVIRTGFRKSEVDEIAAG